uniref:hypothetical protein n=1 Tax=Acetatifactor sp. TaxID=1872090 RepID=UPI004056C6DF
MGKIKKDKNPDSKPIKIEHGVTNEHYKIRNINEDQTNDVKTLQKIFEIFNIEFFAGELDTPVISIEGKMKKELDVSKPEHWYKTDVYSESQRKEDCIGLYLSEDIYTYEFKEVCITLLKAMIMQYDIERYATYGGAKGTGSYKKMITNNKNYYSKAYAKKCEECGLNAEPIKVKKNGEEENSGKYMVTAAERFNEVYEKHNLDKFRLVLHKTKIVPKEKEESGKGQSMRAYICPTCGLIIRVTKKDPVNIVCYNDEKCADGTRFILKEN